MRGVAFLAAALALVAGLGGFVAVADAASPATASWSATELRLLVERASLESGVDPRLVDALVRVESAYDPTAVSHKGAMGLMQLMPATASRLRVGDPFDPEQNVRGGVREFRRLVDRYAGNLALALAAYNAGEGAVARYRGVPPYPETRTYVSRILTIYHGRPYTLGDEARSRRPVRLTTDPATGRLVITNVGAASSTRASGISIGTSNGGVLGGGFGQSGR